VAVIDPGSGELIDRRGFDITASGSEAEASALVDFVADVAEGQIVVIALQGEGTAYLSDGVLGAFFSIGGQVDLRGTSGWSHAIIGVKGAAAGTALEAVGPENGWLRVAPDIRTLAIAVDTILWERVE
jgi:hypothetical protein